MAMPDVGVPLTNQDGSLAQTHMLGHVDNDQAKQDIGKLQGDRRDKADDNTRYVEIKAPPKLTKGSSVPYGAVLPQYRKQAEQAMKRNQVPKDKQKLVKEYFESLSGGKKGG